MFKLFKPTKSVTFITGPDLDERVEAPFRSGDTVLEAALRNEIELPHSCGGMGTCGTCRVVVVNAPKDLESRNEIEAEMALDRGFGTSERLACQLRARHGLKLRIPEESS